MFSLHDLQELFFPGIGKVLRVPNRLRKGYLKKSVLSIRSAGSKYIPHQGKKECERRTIQAKQMHQNVP